MIFNGAGRQWRWDLTLLCGLICCSLVLATLLVERRAAEAPRAVPSVPFVSDRPLPGFAFDKVMCAAWSRDRATWSPVAALLRGCDTPQLGWVGDRLFAYYMCHAGFARTEIVADGAGGYRAGQSSLLDIEGHWLGGDTDPSLLRLPGGGYRLFYTVPAPGADPARVPTEVRSASSADGLKWRMDPGYRVSGLGLVDPEAVIAPDGRFRLYYTLGSDRRVHSAVSEDGLAFDPEPGARVDGGVSSTTRLENGEYLMVYQGGVPRALHAATSPDGLRFSEDASFASPGSPQLSAEMESPSLTLMPDGSWLMIFMLGEARVAYAAQEATR